MNYMPPLEKHPLNIAVIGTGIAGLSAAWMLNKRHTITVYETNRRIGGHSNTVDVDTDSGATPVDTGFIVYNERNYPNLTALFDFLEVPTKDSEMSFAASIDSGAFEYAGTDLNGLFGQRSNLVKPRFWRMMKDLLRFYREAPQFLKESGNEAMSLGTYLERENYSQGFLKDHLLPIGAAIWSTTAQEMMDYPAKAFIRFFESHGLLLIRNRPQWRTVDGGSREYVKRLSKDFQDKIRYKGAKKVERQSDHVLITDETGQIAKFDHVVIAIHADEALALLADPNLLEQQTLGPWRYTRNRAVLHRDATLMPRRKRVWSSWNFMQTKHDSSDKALCVSYWMNRLQSIDPTNPLFLTLNPHTEPAPGTIYQEFDYTHPFFDTAALETQGKLWDLQGVNRTWFCGSYFGYGFHEDALQSGLAVGEQLGGVKRPWDVAHESGRIQMGSSARVAAE